MIWLATALAWPAAAFAQSPGGKASPPAVNPGRPTVTDPASLTAPGWLETEFGGQDNWDRGELWSTPVVFKLTMKNQRVEYRLSSDGLLIVPHGADAIGNTYLAGEYLFRDQQHFGWDLTARYTLTLPTAPSGFGSRKVDHAILLLASRDFAHSHHGDVTAHVDLNMGVADLARQSAGGRDTELLGTASFTFPLPGGRWQYTNELVYQSPIAGQRSQVTTMHGVSYAVHAWDVYDVALQWQLHGDGPVWQLLFGRTFFLGRLF
ncbi:MAG: hypothetical protein KGJ62_09855 [Armatimonadetes bacterium]|nr:hypothetical protein [Armatimonadota bacterium]